MADDHYGEQRDEAYRKMYTLEKGKRQKTLLGALAREHAPSRYFTQVRSGAYPPFRVPPSQTPSPRQVPEIWDQLMHEAMPETGTEDGLSTVALGAAIYSVAAILISCHAVAWSKRSWHTQSDSCTPRARRRSWRCSSARSRNEAAAHPQRRCEAGGGGVVEGVTFVVAGACRVGVGAVRRGDAIDARVEGRLTLPSASTTFHGNGLPMGMSSSVSAIIGTKRLRSTVPNWHQMYQRPDGAAICYCSQIRCTGPPVSTAGGAHHQAMA